MNSGCQEGFSVNNLFPTLLLNSIRTEKIYRNFSFLLFFYYAHHHCVRLSEAVAHRCSLKKVLLKIAKNFQKNSHARGLQLYLKKRLWHRCFPVNFAKFLRTTFFVEHLCWLLLGYLFQVFIPTVSYDYWLSKYFFYF